MSPATVRPALILALVLSAALVGWGIVSAQPGRQPFGGQPRPGGFPQPQPPRFPQPPVGMPQPQFPQPFKPPVIQPPPTMPQPFKPPQVNPPPFNPNPVVFVDRYQCNTCGKIIEVPQGGATPNVCPGCGIRIVGVAPPHQAGANNPNPIVRPNLPASSPMSSYQAGKVVGMIMGSLIVIVGLVVGIIFAIRASSGGGSRGSNRASRPRRRRPVPDYDD